jgi:hypothetical protein
MEMMTALLDLDTFADAGEWSVTYAPPPPPRKNRPVQIVPPVLPAGLFTLTDHTCCTARGFWDTGLNPTPPWRRVEAASVGRLPAS